MVTNALLSVNRGLMRLLLPSLSALALPVVASETAAAASAASASSVETRIVDVEGVKVAYRMVGPERAPVLLLLNRFRGTMDHWDPVIIDRLACEHRVLMFDQPGFSRSEGTPSDSLAAFAAKAVQVADKLGVKQFDLLGFSMGGTVALQLLLDHPEKVRRAVIAGSGPGYVPGDVESNRPAGADIWQVATKPQNSDEDFLFLFFEPTETSQQAGKAYLSRLQVRKDAFLKQVEAPAWQGQLKSAMAIREPNTSLLPKLLGIKHPVLVLNGRHDVMVPTYASYAMAQALPNATLKIYPDAGHGFLFQYPEEFAADVLRFLKQ